MKYFTLNRNYNDILITLMVMIFLGAGYFYLYVPQNEKWEAYSKLITYTATLGAGIPKVVKLFSLFDNSSSKS